MNKTNERPGLYDRAEINPLCPKQQECVRHMINLQLALWRASDELEKMVGQDIDTLDLLLQDIAISVQVDEVPKGSGLMKAYLEDLQSQVEADCEVKNEG